MIDAIYELDFMLLDLISNLRCGFLDAFLGFFTTIGNDGMVWIAAALVLLIIPKHRRAGIAMAIGLIVCLLTGSILLKNLIARPRPFILDTDIILAIPAPSGYSFPSGHTFSSFISAAILSKYSRKFALAAIPIAIIIGFSRLYFCVHFPTDVLAGMILGITLGLAVYKLCEKIPDRKAK